MTVTGFTTRADALAAAPRYERAGYRVTLIELTGTVCGFALDCRYQP